MLNAKGRTKLTEECGELMQTPDPKIIEVAINFLDDRDYFESDYGYRPPENYDKEMLLDHFSTFASQVSTQAVRDLIEKIKAMPDDESGDEDGHYAQGCINTKRAIIKLIETEGESKNG